MKSIIAILILLLSLTNNIIAQDELIWKKANYAYQSSDYNEAIHLYKQIKNYNASAQILYNIGTTYIKNAQIGNGILFLERAKQLNPSDKNISTNLKAAQSRIIDPIENNEFVLTKWLRAFVNIFSINVWSILFIGLLLLSAISFIFKEKNKSKLSLVFRISLGLLFIPILALMLHYFYFNNQKYVIAIVGQQPFYVDASMKELSTRTIPEGTKAQIIEDKATHYKIQLPNGIVAYVKKHNFERL